MTIRKNVEKTFAICPTCGVPCTIGGDDKEGTHYYLPQVNEVIGNCYSCNYYNIKKHEYTESCFECKRYYTDMWWKKTK